MSGYAIKAAKVKKNKIYLKFKNFYSNFERQFRLNSRFCPGSCCMICAIYFKSAMFMIDQFFMSRCRELIERLVQQGSLTPGR